jgi:hypothetical protein
MRKNGGQMVPDKGMQPTARHAAASRTVFTLASC